MRQSRGWIKQNRPEMKTEASRKPLPLDPVLASVLMEWRACVPVQPARRLDLRLSNEARNPTVLAECCNGRSHPSSRKTGGHHEAHWLACLQTFLCNSVEGARCRCQNHPGAAQRFYVACFTRCLYASHDTGKARGAERHHKLVVTCCYRELARHSDTAVSD